MKYSDHKCPRCERIYIVFKPDITCPNCGFAKIHQGHEHFSFIPEVVKKMKAQRSRYGRYDGPEWEEGTLAGELGRACAEIFEHIERVGAPDPHIFFQNVLNDAHWNDRLYLKIHLRDLLSHMYPYYRRQTFWQRFMGGFKRAFSLPRFS